MSNWIEQSLAEVDRFTPASGFNVVAVDSFALPGEGLYLVKHCDSEVDAENARREHASKSGEKTYVYPAQK